MFNSALIYELAVFKTVCRSDPLWNTKGCTGVYRGKASA